MRSTVQLLLILPLALLAATASVRAEDDLAVALTAWQNEEALPPLDGSDLLESPFDEPEQLPMEQVAPPTTDDAIIAEEVVVGSEIEVEPQYIQEHAWQEPPSFWARVVSTAECINDSSAYFESEFVLLHRTAPAPRVIARDVSIPTNGSVNASSSAFRIEPGLRMTLGKNLFRDDKNRDHSVEFTFFGLFDWESPDGIRSQQPNNLFTPLDPGFPFAGISFGGFNQADTYATLHSSNLNSFEFNGRMKYRLGRDRMVMNPDGTWSRQINPGLVPSILYGVRVVVIEEAFSARARADGVDFSDFGGNYDVDTENVMVGFQVGGDLMRREEKLEYGFRLKFAALVNFAFQDTSIASNDIFTGQPTINSAFRADEANMGFLGEGNFGIKYFLHPNWAVRANAELMWIQGIAVATQQQNFDLGIPPMVNVDANAFYLGISFGLEGSW